VIAIDTLTHMRKLYLFPGYSGSTRNSERSSKMRQQVEREAEASSNTQQLVERGPETKVK